MEQESIHLLWAPRTVVSDNATWFTSKTLKEFIKARGTSWMTVLAYAPMTYGRAERMVGTSKRSAGRVVAKRKEQWDRAVHFAMSGYRRRKLSSGRSSVEFLFGVKPRMLLSEKRGCHHASQGFREIELLALLGPRAARDVNQALDARKKKKSLYLKLGNFFCWLMVTRAPE